MNVNLQHSTESCVSYLYSTRTVIWAVVKPRVPWIVPIKKLVGTGVDICTGLRLACEAPAPCTTVETCGAPVVGLWSDSDDSTRDADITFKINRCKQI